MGLFDSIFGSGSETSTQSQTTTPWDDMRDWQFHYYWKEAQKATELLNQQSKIYKDLAKNPAELQDLTKRELNANKDLQAQVDKSQKIGNQAVNTAAGTAEAALRNVNRDTAGLHYDPLNLKGAGQTHQQVSGRLDRDINQAQRDYAQKVVQPSLQSLQEGTPGYGKVKVRDLGDTSKAVTRQLDKAYKRNENAYTDDVVKSTLHGMTREAQREQAMRGASEASFGGMSSTRGAVADALSQQLTGMNKAQMEAKLRSDAFDVARRTGQSELGITQQQQGIEQQTAQMQLQRDQLINALGLDKAKFEAQLRGDSLTTAYDLGIKTAGLGQGQQGIDQNAAAMELQRQQLMNTLGLDKAQLEMAAREMGLTEAQLLDQFATSALERQKVGSSFDAAQGALQRGINDTNAEAERTAQRDAASWYGQMFGATSGITAPVASTTTGTTTTPTASPFSQAVGTAAQAAGAYLTFSDENVKHDIVPDESSGLEKLAKIPTYSYEYDEGYGPPGRIIGNMAQDYEHAGIDGAVIDTPRGKIVNPFPVLATIVQAVRELDARSRPIRAGL